MSHCQISTRIRIVAILSFAIAGVLRILRRFFACSTRTPQFRNVIIIYAVWMGGAGGVGDGFPMVSRVSL